MIDKKTGNKINKIVKELVNARNKSGMQLDSLAEKCAHEWHSAISTAKTYISRYMLNSYGWEYAINNTRKHHQDYRNDLIFRTMNYLSLVGYSESEKIDFFKRLKKIYSDIKYPNAPSDSLDSFEGLRQFKGYRT